MAAGSAHTSTEQRATRDRGIRQFAAALRKAGFEGQIADYKATRLVNATDNSIYQVLPPLVLFPRVGDDISLIARVAAEPTFRELAFAARGGGTGTNGQALSRGIVVDTSRHLTRILEVDAEACRVRVEPGVVLDQLNRRLAREGLFFPPHTSTASRATLGGMIGTDACGKGSARYGRTHDYVESLDVVLADGSELTLRGMDADALATDQGAAGRIARHLAARCDGYREGIAAAFPRMARSLTGYNLRDAFPETGGVNLHHLFVGAEGTLGLVREATLRVLPLPAVKGMAVVRYRDITAALEDARTLLDTAPSAIETLDERLFGLARGDSDWPRVRAALVGDRDDGDRAVNFVEYEADSEAALETRFDGLQRALTASDRCLGHYRVGDAAEAAALWGIRSRSVGMLARTHGARKPVPFIEDTVVPPQRLPEYIRQLRALLDGYGLDYAMFGHVDVGCLHVRPAMDMTDPADAALVREIGDQVVELLKAHRGLLWGEHGKGFRGEYTRAFFGDAVYPLLAEVKRAFDPDNRMNPGKIVAPDGDEARIERVDAVPTRGEHDRQIPPAVRFAWDKAVACNGNGVCFDWDERQAICPSYKITGDRIHSPKGRAGLLREWLRRDLPGQPADPDFEHAVYAALGGCLGCKACATQCPVHVDIPAMRARFLADYHRRHRRPLRDHLVARLENWAPLLAAAAPLVNGLLHTRAGLGISRRLGLADPPRWARQHALRDVEGLGARRLSAADASRQRGRLPDSTVFIRPDAFTAYLDPEVLRALVRAVGTLGGAPVVLDYAPSGKALHVHGFMQRFRSVAEREADALEALNRLGHPVLVLEPSIALMYRDEYPKAFPARDWGAVRLVHEWLWDICPTQASGTSGRAYQLFLHCTERTAAPEAATLWQRLFQRLGLDLELVPAGCCGMAGIYGHQVEHQTQSRGLYDLSWRQSVERVPAEKILATGYSCRSQVLRQSGFRPRHPIEVVAECLQRRT